jgi:hypothetical protein
MRAFWLLLVMLLWCAGMSHAATLRLDWDYTQGTDLAVKFRVYRQTGCVGAFTALTPDVQPVTATPATYTFRDTTLIAGQQYCWQATALDATGKESGPTNTVTFQLPGVLSNPTNLRGTLEQ